MHGYSALQGLHVHAGPEVCVLDHQVGGDCPGDIGEGRLALCLPKEAHI